MEPLKVEPLAGRRRSAALLISAGLCLAALAAAFVGFSGFLDYFAGLRNASGGFAQIGAVLACGVVWLLCLAGQVWVVLRVMINPTILSTRLACVFLGLLMFGACAMGSVRPFGDDPYARGLARWTEKNVDVAAIRAWHAGLPTAPAPVVVPAGSWPAAVARVAPASVTVLPTGVVLQWGTLSTWGDSRKVFIGVDPALPPPQDDTHPWSDAGKGVWVAQQVAG